jgi:hypothetical protein
MIELLDLERDCSGTWRVRGLAGFPRLLIDRKSLEEFPLFEDVRLALLGDGWQLQGDERKIADNQITQTSLTLIHSGTPPRPAQDIVAAPRPSARVPVGVGYSSWGLRWSADSIVSQHAIRVEQIAGDGLATLSGQAENAQAQPARQNALAALDRETKAALAAVEADREDLETQAADAPFTPPDGESLDRLEYVRKVLAARWPSQATLEILDDWKLALAAGDRVAVRVFMDFGVSEIQSRPPWNGQPSDAWPPESVSKLMAESRRALMNDVQRQAVDRLAEMDAARAKIEAADRHQRARLEGAAYDTHYGLVDGPTRVALNSAKF